jgi:class 3 adenylate cyclase
VRTLGIQVRAGLHTGECELRGNDLGGRAVHIAATTKASEVLASSTVKDLVAGSATTFQDRGEHTLKGVPDTCHLLAASTLPI